MKRNLIITLSLLVIFTLTGCLKSSETKTNIISDNESNIEILKTLSPSRDEIKSNILSRLGKNNKAPKLTGELGNYYFVLSDKNISISSNSGTTEVQFIYIENYQSTSTEEVEITTEGKIRYFYEIVDNQWNLIDFDLVIENLPKGTVTGNIKFFDNNVPGLKVFGKNGEEYTKVVKTDSNGIFTINNILFNDYDFHIFGESFEDTVINTITVDTEEVIELGVINILPKETVDFAALTGYIFFDLYKERPVKNANVWLEQNNIPVYDISVSNEAGYYFINNITEGTYILNASIENNIETKEVNIYINNYGSAKVEDLVLLNQSPEITYTSHSTTDEIILSYTDSIKFIIEANDIDNDSLTYSWNTARGNLSPNFNTCDFYPTTPGLTEVSLEISDMKGGHISLKWNIKVTDSSLIFYSRFKNSNIIDESIYNNNGTSYGNIDFYQGENFPYNYCQFYSDGSYINIPVLPKVSNSSISFCVNVTDTSLFEYFLGAYNQDGMLMLAIENSKLKAIIERGSDGARIFNDCLIDFNLNSNEWYHFTLLFQTDMIRVFLNKTELSSVLWNMGTPDDSRVLDFAIGTCGRYTANDFTGKLSEIRIYDKILNNEEIQALY